MREIKFRAIVIDDDGKERLEYNVWPTGPSPGMRHLRGFVDNGGFWMDCIRFEQFTGLKDKNGKEIYEGDILKHPIEKRWFPWIIEFHGGSFCLVNIGIDGYKHEPMYLTEDRVSEREIIGNIYENPELLK